jgi:type IV pilus assembly protein PilO
MAGLPTNQRDQIMMLIGAIGLIGAGGYWYAITSPKSAELEVLRTRVETLQGQNQRAASSAARGTSDKIKAESKKLSDNLDLMRTLIPTGNEVPALLDQILGAARRTGLEFTNFQPNATVQGETFDTMKYRISIQGPYHKVGELLASIGSLRRIIVPTNVTLTATGTGGRNAAAPSANTEARRRAAEERVLTANFDVQTYVLRTATEDDK